MRRYENNSKDEIQRVIVKREARSYKGDFGRLLLVGRTYPMGAIMLAALRFIVVEVGHYRNRS